MCSLLLTFEAPLKLVSESYKRLTNDTRQRGSISQRKHKASGVLATHARCFHDMEANEQRGQTLMGNCTIDQTWTNQRWYYQCTYHVVRIPYKRRFRSWLLNRLNSGHSTSVLSSLLTSLRAVKSLRPYIRHDALSDRIKLQEHWFLPFNLRDSFHFFRQYSQHFILLTPFSTVFHSIQELIPRIFSNVYQLIRLRKLCLNADDYNVNNTGDNKVDDTAVDDAYINDHDNCVADDNNYGDKNDVAVYGSKVNWYKVN